MDSTDYTDEAYESQGGIERPISRVAIYPGAKRRGRQNCWLVRDLDGQYDPNAIPVYSQRNEGVGCIARNMAAKLAPMMDMGAHVYGKVLGRRDQFRMLIEVLEG